MIDGERKLAVADEASAPRTRRYLFSQERRDLFNEVRTHGPRSQDFRALDQMCDLRIGEADEGSSFTGVGFFGGWRWRAERDMAQRRDWFPPNN